MLGFANDMAPSIINRLYLLSTLCINFSSVIYVACLLYILYFSDNCRTEKEKQTLLRERQAEDEVKKSGINARGWEVCYLQIALVAVSHYSKAVTIDENEIKSANMISHKNDQ